MTPLYIMRQKKMSHPGYLVLSIFIKYWLQHWPTFFAVDSMYLCLLVFTQLSLKVEPSESKC